MFLILLILVGFFVSLVIASRSKRLVRCGWIGTGVYMALFLVDGAASGGAEGAGQNRADPIPD
jgi:hypothetical protein